MYKDLIKKVEQVMREADVFGLIEAGAPKDEYKGEAGVISRKLQETPTRSELQVLIVDLIKQKFNIEIPQSKRELLIDTLLQIKVWLWGRGTQF